MKSPVSEFNSRIQFDPKESLDAFLVVLTLDESTSVTPLSSSTQTKIYLALYFTQYHRMSSTELDGSGSIRSNSMPFSAYLRPRMTSAYPKQRSMHLPPSKNRLNSAASSNDYDDQNALVSRSMPFQDTALRRFIVEKQRDLELQSLIGQMQSAKKRLKQSAVVPKQKQQVKRKLQGELQQQEKLLVREKLKQKVQSASQQRFLKIKGKAKEQALFYKENAHKPRSWHPLVKRREDLRPQKINTPIHSRCKGDNRSRMVSSLSLSSKYRSRQEYFRSQFHHTQKYFRCERPTSGSSRKIIIQLKDLLSRQEYLKKV